MRTAVLAAVALGAGVALTPSPASGAYAPPLVPVTVAPPSYAGRSLYVSQTPSGAALARLTTTAGPTATTRTPPRARTVAATAPATPDETARRTALLRKIAGQPQAQWVGDWVPMGKVRATVAALTVGPRKGGTVLPLVVYNLPHRDCSSFSRGGAASAAAYKAWIDEVAAGIGTTRTIVVLEPDALPSMHCLPPAAQSERLELLRYAGRKLQARPNAEVYLDAGNALWKPAETMVERLRAAGVAHVRGFALNVANFDTTENEVRYGRRVSAGLGGAAFVVDTSRNGRGALTGALSWCNPPGRGLGERPTTRPGLAGVDALLWVKTIGASDGNCRPGEPVAGTYSLAYALGLAERAAW